MPPFISQFYRFLTVNIKKNSAYRKKESFSPYQFQAILKSYPGHLVPVLWIRIRIYFGRLDPDPHLISGSSRAKSTKISIFYCSNLIFCNNSRVPNHLAFSVELASCLIPLKVNKSEKSGKFVWRKFKTKFTRSRVSKNPGSGSALTKNAGSGSALKLMRIYITA